MQHAIIAIIQLKLEKTLSFQVIMKTIIIICRNKSLKGALVFYYSNFL